jgi:energy-coupling factor transporter ATP-binding protein EcfA2
MRTLPPRPAGAMTPAQHAGPTLPTPAVPTPAGPQVWEGRDILDTPQTASVLHAAYSGDAVIVKSPPGSGKTTLVVNLAAYLAHRGGLHVGIAAQTREQAIQIATRLGLITRRAVLRWSSSAKHLPHAGMTLVMKGRNAKFPASGGGIVIATTSLWQYQQYSQLRADVMLVDEAWQTTYGDLASLGAFAGQIVCVGDPGQIDPVITGNTDRWRGWGHGPHVPGPAGLLHAHPGDLNVIALPHTWRLGPLTTALIQPLFYPDLPFTSRRPPEHVTGPAGPLPEVAWQSVTSTAGPGDPALAAACAARVQDLLDRHTITEAGQTRRLGPADIAVVTAHVSQDAAVRAMLAASPDVLIGTANQLQGLERHAVVALHPLAGYRDLDRAAMTDAGRACVMLTRHRAHLTVIADTITPAAIAAASAPGVHPALLDAIQAAPQLP